MSAVALSDLVTRLPQGSRVRTAYEQLARELGPVLAVNVDWYPRPLWLVAGQREAQALMKEGVPRSNILTASEVRDLLGDRCTLSKAASLLQSPCSA